ncbi:MAG TPA: hypothetical protein ENH85_05465 [Candidatus Scalindua sp.]|nr:hypothetical protein [Candidatus Scalindua sp.]
MGKIIHLARELRIAYVIVTTHHDRGWLHFSRVLRLIQFSVISGLGIEFWNRHLDILPLITLPEIPISFLPWIIVFLPICLFAVGTIDKVWIKIWQTEAAYTTKSINPFLAKIGEDAEEARKGVEYLKKAIRKLMKKVGIE